MVTKCFAHPPMPIGADAVSNSLPESHHEPRKGGDSEANQVPSPSPLPRPAQAVEHDEQRVKDQEKDVEYLQPQSSHDKYN